MGAEQLSTGQLITGQLLLWLYYPLNYVLRATCANIDSAQKWSTRAFAVSKDGSDRESSSMKCSMYLSTNDWLTRDS